MRILIILPDYFPKQNPRVFRWQALAEHWAAKGWEVHFLCAKHSSHPVFEQLNGVFVHRAGYANLMDYRYHYFGVRHRRDEAGDSVRREKPNFLMRLFHWLWRNLYWPDGSWIWISPAGKVALRLLSEQHFDAMISVSLPFSSHLVAQICRQHYPELRWLVDIGDPFAFSEEFPKNNHFLYKRRNFRAERKVLLAADAICVTFDGAMQVYRHVFPDSGGKLWVIPPLIQGIQENFHLDFEFEKGRTHLGYFGAFYKNIRTPEGLLRLMRAFTISVSASYAQMIKIHIFGYVDQAFFRLFEKYPDLHNNIRFHGLLPKNAALALMRQCDFLVNIGNSTIHQLPSKSVDYLNAGKPIVNIARHEQDTFAEFLHDHPKLLNLVLDNHSVTQQQVKAFSTFLEKEKGKEVDRDWVEDKIERHSLGAIANLYEDLISEKCPDSINHSLM